MMLALVLVFGFHLPFGSQLADVVLTERRKIGQWSLELSHNTFTNRTICRLHTKNIELEGDALVFHFSKTTDTFGAWYSIDHAKSQYWRHLIPELLLAGVKLESSDIVNPSLGRVPIPVQQLKNVSVIDIAPNDSDAPRSFDLSDFSKAKSISEYLDCHFD